MAYPEPKAERRPLRLAVFGVLAENAASSAGAYPVVLKALLERGYRVEFFGNPNYVRPRSLEGTPGFRFHPLRVEAMENLWERAAALRTPYPSALVSQVGHIVYHRESVKRIEEEHRREPFDLALCTDMHPLWPSALPVIAWPQGPPQTEGAALRDPAVARAVIRHAGVRYFASVQAFYAYRVAVGLVSLRHADLYLCGSRWAADAWRRFGVPADHVEPFPYPVELAAFRDTPPLGQGTTMFLWLGRATPRKRLDLFLDGFALLRARQPKVRARVVGAARDFGRAVLEQRGPIVDLAVEPAVPREAVPALFGAVDVLVQPSQSENFGFSIAEALASGRAVVGGPTNGTFEYAERAGFGFDRYTPESVALAMERAMHAVNRDPGAVSRAARQDAQVFALDRVVEHFCELAARLVDRRR